MGPELHTFNPGKIVSKVLLFTALLLMPVVAVAENTLPPGYPDTIERYGVLGEVDGDEVLISKKRWPLVPGASFNLPEQLGTESGNIPTGSKIGFILDEDGRVESVWSFAEGRKKKQSGVKQAP